MPLRYNIRNKVYSALVENFPQTYFVGGAVRDMLLNRDIVDIDIATIARPEQIEKVLYANKIKFDNKHARYGSVAAKEGRETVEITTFRQDLPAQSRYPEVRFVKTPKQDSQRRDFTINALYYSPRTGKVLDFHNGQHDLKNWAIKFIGSPGKRITEDPLRIIRAYRFALQLKFNFDPQTERALKKYSHLIKNLSATKIESEITKLKPLTAQKNLKKIINSLALDD